MSRVLVLGAGAIGQWLGGLLACSGAEVLLLARPPHLEALSSRGLQFEGRPGGFPARVLASLEDLTPDERRCDWLVLAVKAFAVEDALAEVRQAGLNPTRILAIQNGVGTDDQVAACFGKARTFVGTVTCAVACPAPGVVRPESRGGLALAPMARGEQPGDLPTRLTAQGVPVFFLTDAAAMKWSKLLLNLVANASCAILDLSCRQLLADRDLFRVELQALREALQVMERKGLVVVDLPGYPVRLLARAVRWMPEALAFPLLGPKMAAGRGDKPPSLLLDLRAGRTVTEVAWMNGAIAMEAANLEMEAPVNRFLARTLMDLARGYLAPGIFRHDPGFFLDLLATASSPDRGKAGEDRRSPGP
ncbi:MAG: ketopantoate reductase family protein [Candidatus Xenobium sp.]|nr:2-dehydropantoate 2-reductase [Burkholderiales bacterium]